MKFILTIFKNTLIRGLLFSLPLIIMLIIADHAIEKVEELTGPIADMLPYHSVFGVGKAYWAVLVLILLIGLVMGLIAKIKIANALLRALEEKLLDKLPGYAFMKQMGESMIGPNSKREHKVILVKIEEAWQMAFAVEEINEHFTAVFIPTTANPFEGELCFVSVDRIKVLNMSYAECISLLSRQGVGSGNALKDILMPIGQI